MISSVVVTLTRIVDQCIIDICSKPRVLLSRPRAGEGSGAMFFQGLIFAPLLKWENCVNLNV